MTTAALDTQKAEAFAENLLGVINGGCLSLMTSIGHRTGLFDTMSTLAPSTSEQIAAAAGLNERYVREWLGAVTLGGFVEYDADGGLYSLPPEHAACLTRANAADNMAVFAQYIAVMGEVEDKIVDCFRNGGGVPYSEFTRFHEVMAEDSGQSVVSSLREHILPLMPDVVEALEQGIDVLDVACGSGRALNRMAGAFPNSRFTGYDLCPEPIAAAKADAAREGLTNVTFEQKDVATLAVPEQFDFITVFDGIHDQAQPDVVLGGIQRALKPTGTFLMQDIAGSSHLHKNLDHPLGPFLYSISTMHCMTVSLAQGGMGLGTMWGVETATEMLNAAGFPSVDVKELPHDPQNYYYVARKTA